MRIDQGARIIVEDWLQARRDDVFHYITDEQNLPEAEAFSAAAARCGAVTKVTVLDSASVQPGEAIEELRHAMSLANAIIGATQYSFITTNAVQYALRRGARFLSLPMSTSGGSLFEQDFIAMPPHEALRIARPLAGALSRAETIRAVTALGTDITFSKKDRPAGYFCGRTTRTRRISSASFEVYVPVVETSATGRVVLDGSLGYLGLVSEPLELRFQDGYLTGIADTPDGARLRAYLAAFQDPEMACAAEFGIGVNRLAECRGQSYIEDESAFGTFHIGFGRNLALGGGHDAAGHFDIVVRTPDLYAGSVRIMSSGVPF